MTRTTRLLGLAMVLALLMALVSTATAAPPEGKGKPTTTTAATVDPGSLGVGFSCEDYRTLKNQDADGGPDSWATSEESISFDLTTEVFAYCIDVSNAAAGSLEIEVVDGDVPDRARTLYAVIKDSTPGDHCGEPLNIDLKKRERSGTLADLPAATLNACGTEYAEGDVVWSDAEEWEIVNVVTERDTSTVDPLVLVIGFSGQRDSTMNVTVKYTAD